MPQIFQIVNIRRNKMAILITSDLHLNHDKDFIYGSRGYSTVEEMNEDR